MDRRPEFVHLRTLATIRPGVNKPKAAMGSGVRYVTVQDLYGGTSVHPEKLQRTRLSEVEIGKFCLDPGDIIICKSSVKRTGIGYPSKFLGFSEPVAYSGFTARVRAQVEVACPDYLFHVLRWSKTRQWIIRHSQQSALTNLNRSIMDAIPIPLLPLSEQRRIASILSSVDKAIEKTQAVIDQVQVVKHGLMQELFTRGPPGRHTRFKQTGIGEIPADWEVARIEDLGQQGRPAVKAGPFGSSLKKSFYVSEGYRVYGQEQVLARDLSVGNYYIDERRFRSLKSCEVKAGDILMSLVGTFGEAIVVSSEAEPGIINPRLLRLSLDPLLVLPEFFCYWLHSGATRRLLEDTAQGGTMGVLNASIVKKLALGRPPLAEQSEIVAALSAIDRRLDGEFALNAALVAAKAALLSVLLTGELRVTPDTEAA